MKPILLVAGCILLAGLVLVLARGGERPAPAAAGSAAEARGGAEPPDALAGADTPGVSPAETSSTPASAEAEPGAPAPPASAALALPSDDPVRCVLYGRVLDASGGSLAGKEIDVRLEDPSGTHVRAATTTRGSYSATGLAPGRWLVACYADGYRQTKVPLELGPERVVRHDLELEPAVMLRIKLTAPDGSPFREALSRAGTWTTVVPVATVDPPGATFDGVVGSLNNAFGVGTFWQNGYVFEQLPPEYYGVLVLDGEPPVHVSIVLQSAVLATQRVEAGTEEVAFVLDPQVVIAARSALRCRVVDAGTGAPLEGAEVALIARGGGMRLPSPSTDAQGVALLQDYEPGEYELWVRAEGSADVRRAVALIPGQTLEVDAIELVPETWIAGRLIDEAGAPVEATVQLGQLDVDGRLAMVKNQYWKSDNQGAFRIGALAPGRYIVRTAAREGRPGYPELTMATDNHLISTLGGPVENLELLLLPLGRLVLRYERADWEALRYSALDERGLERAGGRLWDTLQHTVTLPHGVYRVLVTDVAGATVLEQFVTVGEEPAVIEVPPE